MGSGFAPGGGIVAAPLPTIVSCARPHRAWGRAFRCLFGGGGSDGRAPGRRVGFAHPPAAGLCPAAGPQRGQGPAAPPPRRTGPPQGSAAEAAALPPDERCQRGKVVVVGPAGVKARGFGWRFAAVERAQIQRIFICFHSNRSVDVQKQNPYPKGTRRHFLIPYTKS